MFIQDIVLKLKIVSGNSFTWTVRKAAFIGITAAVIGPVLLLAAGGREASNLPWYIWIITLLALTLVIQIGILMFRRKSQDGKDISIRPKNR